MSAINLSGNASGSGTFTIASPNSNTSYTLALPEEAGTITTSNSPYSTFRNRIINGDMRIDQRNAGASVTVNSSTATFPVDRFAGRGQTSAGVFTAQQSSTAPTGFTSSVICTVTTAASPPGATDAYLFRQNIEGLNVADLGWGTASAKTVTLSFWVRSSLTGTFGGALQNSAFNRFYPFSYSISAANTWEYKTVTIAGDTSGTWLTTNGIGITLSFSLGAGSSRVNTAGSWTASTTEGASGQVNLIATNGATWYITGVQLEVGSVATPFERRPYGLELSLCQRYFVNLQNLSGSWGFNKFGYGVGGGGSDSFLVIPTPVTLRAIPTVSFSGVSSTIGAGGTVVSSITVNTANAIGVQITAAAGTYSLGQFVFIQSGSLSLSAEL